MKKTILFAANRGYALLSSRRGLIERFLKDGWQVVLATAEDDESRELVRGGAILDSVAFNRRGLSPLADWRAGRKLRQAMQKRSPALVHFFHAKPVIIGTLAARWALGDDVRILNTITGLGHAFMENKIVARLAGTGYQMALSKADMTIFQNRDDRAFFLKHGWLPQQKATLIAGSGVPLERFPYIDRSGRDPSRPIVAMLARLLNQKGIPEFARVARSVKSVIPGARFLLAGEQDPSHRDALDMDWLLGQSHIEYLGRLNNVVSLLEQADLLVFPSYYREGIPRVVMEAAATGLPAVAFDVPGVREAIQDGQTGYLVPERDVEAMTQVTLALLQDVRRRLEMGRKANELAVEHFDIHAIQEEYFKIYRKLGVDI